MKFADGIANGRYLRHSRGRGCNVRVNNSLVDFTNKAFDFVDIVGVNLQERLP